MELQVLNARGKQNRVEVLRSFRLGQAQGLKIKRKKKLKAKRIIERTVEGSK